MALSPARQQEIETQLGALSESLAPDELLWASGYMAGLAAADGPADATSALPAAGEILAVWYATETGNARGVAERLADAAREIGYAVELASLADVPPRRIGKVDLLMLVVATHGEGDPPEGTEAFFEYLASDRAPQLDALRYAVFALGDSSYPDFCQVGRDVDARLQSLGAQRLLDRIDSDVDIETHEDPWRARVLDKIAPLFGNEAGESAHIGPRLHVVREDKAAPARHDRRNPFHAEVLGVSPLTVAPSNKRVAHVALLLEGSGLAYQPGAALGVWPTNDARLVDEILELTGADAGAVVERDGQSLPLSTWLSERLELTQVVRPFLEAWAEQSRARELAELLDDRERLQAFVTQRQVADIIRAYPVTGIEPATLVGALRGIAPRLYSIASSPLVADDEVHLTVKLEGGARDGLLRAGAASWQLVERLAPGDTLPVYIEPNDRFCLPADGDRPIIMIGPGTGVAPFRAFVGHRQALGHSGRNWLLFGEQHRRTDFLYQLDWQRFLKEGALDRLSVAFSRDPASRIYVQHRIREQGRELYAWIEDGAHVYVCGSGRGMAADVHSALVEVIAEHAGRTPEAAGEVLTQMKHDRRYQRDVY
ncbi:MAG: hypothetical protein HND55_01075 [Pseudomonadota bacterium]|nr:MAG: hypothetical protein HND55_01075 [Pseudomonadota bacterium]